VADALRLRELLGRSCKRCLRQPALGDVPRDPRDAYRPPLGIAQRELDGLELPRLTPDDDLLVELRRLAALDDAPVVLPHPLGRLR
jgi:hypothetical protein